ncbi:MAG: hypothetical protein HW405_98 [Candidatus Berkelbacteria bacterium]|nr:hypothetical protein [Candidatus Berkelbacteria bacterium]
MSGETPSFNGENFSPEVNKPSEVTRPRYDLSKFIRYLGIVGGMAAASSGIEGRIANAAPEQKLNPVQESLMQERATDVIATNAVAMQFFPEKIIRETDGWGKTHLRFEARVDVNMRMTDAIESSPILMGQVQEATAKVEKASEKISRIYKQRSEMVDKMAGLSQ